MDVIQGGFGKDRDTNCDEVLRKVMNHNPSSLIISFVYKTDQGEQTGVAIAAGLHELSYLIAKLEVVRNDILIREMRGEFPQPPKGS